MDELVSSGTPKFPQCWVKLEREFGTDSQAPKIVKRYAIVFYPPVINCSDTGAALHLNFRPTWIRTQGHERIIVRQEPCFDVNETESFATMD